MLEDFLFLMEGNWFQENRLLVRSLLRGVVIAVFCMLGLSLPRIYEFIWKKPLVIKEKRVEIPGAVPFVVVLIIVVIGFLLYAISVDPLQDWKK